MPASSVPLLWRRLAFLAVCAATTLRSAAAHEPGAHVHGVAEMRVVVDCAQLEVPLESPLDNLLGFEHAPRTETERAAVRTMAATLRKSRLFAAPAIRLSHALSLRWYEKEPNALPCLAWSWSGFGPDVSASMPRLFFSSEPVT